MASLNVRGPRFSFEGPEGETLLLDCDNYLSNKSRVSMHRMPEQNFPTIPEILMGLIQRQQNEEEPFALPFGLMDVLLASRLIRSAKPVKLLEYGSGRGELSVHLAELLGAFHEESSLVCAYDAIEPAWTERISRVERLPKLSFLAGDFGALGLQEGGFDFVVLNGLADFVCPHEVLTDAMRLVKSTGTLICYASSAPLLESTFKLFFETREEYPLSPSVSVMLARAEDCCRQKQESPDLAAQVERDIAEAKALAAEKGGLAEALRRLQDSLQTAVLAGETELKVRLLDEKEALIDRLTLLNALNKAHPPCEKA